jgi:hypothetical protein
MKSPEMLIQASPQVLCVTSTHLQVHLTRNSRQKHPKCTYPFLRPLTVLETSSPMQSLHILTSLPTVQTMRMLGGGPSATTHLFPKMYETNIDVPILSACEWIRAKHFDCACARRCQLRTRTGGCNSRSSVRRVEQGAREYLSSGPPLGLHESQKLNDHIGRTRRLIIKYGNVLGCTWMETRPTMENSLLLT